MTTLTNFNIERAIAVLDFKQVGYNELPDLGGLRRRYPELDFVFDQLEDLKAQVNHTVSKDDYDSLESEVIDSEVRARKTGDALLAVRDLTEDVVTDQASAFRILKLVYDRAQDGLS